MSLARTYLEQLLAKGKLEAAIEAGMILCRHYQDAEGNATVVQHSGQYHNLMDDYHAGTISTDDFRPERARISRAMLEWVHSIPDTWHTEGLFSTGFSEKSFDKSMPETQAKSRWPIILGLLGLLGIAAIIWFQLNQPKPEAPAGQQAPATQQTQPAQVQTNPDTLPATKPIINTPKTPIQKSKTQPKTQTEVPVKTTPQSPEPQTKSAPAASDQKFRSFAKSSIYDDMELGYMGDKYAFRNVRTKEILCCYAAAKGFSAGQAYVSLDGKNFFYINKKGEKIQK